MFMYACVCIPAALRVYMSIDDCICVVMARVCMFPWYYGHGYV